MNRGLRGGRDVPQGDAGREGRGQGPDRPRKRRAGRRQRGHASRDRGPASRRDFLRGRRRGVPRQRSRYGRASGGHRYNQEVAVPTGFDWDVIVKIRYLNL